MKNAHQTNKFIQFRIFEYFYMYLILKFVFLKKFLNFDYEIDKATVSSILLSPYDAKNIFVCLCNRKAKLELQTFTYLHPYSKRN